MTTEKYTVRVYEDVEEPEDLHVTLHLPANDWKAHVLSVARTLLNCGTGRVVVEKPDGTTWERRVD